MSLFRDIYSQRHEDNRIFISAKEINLHELSHRLPITEPRLFVVFEAYHRIRSDGHRSGAGAGVESCIARSEFTHPFERFASANSAKPAVEAMLSSIRLPFLLDGDESQAQLRWKEGSGVGDDVTDASSLPLDGVGGAVARVSELGERIVAEGSGRHAPLEMRVTIRKVTVVPAARYAVMFEGSEDEDAIYSDNVSDDIAMYFEEFEEMVRAPLVSAAAAEESVMLFDVPDDLAEGVAVGPIWTEGQPAAAWERYRMSFEVYDDEGIDRSDEIAMYFEAYEEGVIRILPLSAERQPSAAAAAAVKGALETVRYEGDGDEANKLTCPICMDDVAIGSHVTRLRCSHRFHGDCIGKWLEKSSTCPLCRSKL